jgi:hypothetical protein
MYCFDKDKFLMERFDDEMVLINVITGYYYSLSGSGPDVLALLDKGLGVEEVAEAVGGGTGESQNVQKLVANFANQLLAESVLILRQPSPQAGTPIHLHGKVTVAFAPPELTKFEDLREILLLDPVHQVDPQAGWPNRQ